MQKEAVPFAITPTSVVVVMVFSVVIVCVVGYIYRNWRSYRNMATQQRREKESELIGGDEQGGLGDDEALNGRQMWFIRAISRLIAPNTMDTRNREGDV